MPSNFAMSNFVESGALDIDGWFLVSVFFRIAWSVVGLVLSGFGFQFKVGWDSFWDGCILIEWKDS